MEWKLIELTEFDKSWIETQKNIQDRILNAFTLVSPEPKPVQEYTSEQKKVVHAMEVIGQIAKLYKKRGKPPVFVPIQAEINPPRRRERLAKQTARTALYGCGICKLPFIGKVRCQCKPVVKARTEAA